MISRKTDPTKSQKPFNRKFSNLFSNKHLRHLPTKKCPQFPRKSAGWPNYEGGRTPPAHSEQRTMNNQHPTKMNAGSPSETLPLPPRPLYNCRARSTNTPYLKKQTQFQKNSNPPKVRYNNNLRPIGHLVTQDKANPNKANFRPKTPPREAQRRPNLFCHKALRKHLKPKNKPNFINHGPPTTFVFQVVS